ncbi:MAG: type III-B CRISPR module RAMP protein Cmr6 [Planctomycetes bacterium]|nr:type III-B CRISPR module RAMP protein Cmr6 [Planctomycetota bacterium]
MRQVLHNVGTPDHVGIAYDAWGPVGDDGKVPDARRAQWLSDLAGIGVSPDYSRSFERWKASFSAPGDRLAELTLASRMLIGHGNASASGVGLTVHHTWGVPLIPGSSLKGLVAHYVDATYGPADPNRKPWEQEGDERVRANYQGVTWNGRRIERGPGAVYRALFGAPDSREDVALREHNFIAGAASGLVTFHDALYLPGSITGDKPFAADVLTVHQKGYYDSAGKSAPNDYDSPNPVAFLTVRPKCRLLLALSGPIEWTELAGQLLSDALEKWGVGGKTTAGYGIGKVGKWTKTEPRRTKGEQVLADLEKYERSVLVDAIERWLSSQPTAEPLRNLLSATPEAASSEQLEIVRLVGAKINIRSVWESRLRDKKSSDAKKTRASNFIERWTQLFPITKN